MAVIWTGEGAIADGLFVDGWGGMVRMYFRRCL